MEQLYQFFLDSKGLSIDSRSIEVGQIFFAIAGEKFDGHKFVDEVIEKGATKIVIHDEAYTRGDKTFLVNDTLECLQKLAHHHRMQLDVPVLGITGSNGKTTTKELIHVVLSKNYRVHTTRGNYNNHIGVPLTLLAAPKDAEILIIEMGANHLNEIDELCTIASPNYGLITNVGLAHVEGFGSYENIIKGKTEMYRYIAKAKGCIFYNDEDRVLTKNLPDETNCVPYLVSDIEFLYNYPTLSFIDTELDEMYSTKLFGIYNQTNIEAAITIGRYFKVLDEDIFDAIEDYIPTMNRSQLIEKDGITYIKDAYNANPSSMKLSIKSLMNFGTKSKCLIIGDMMELGEDKIALHKDILRYIAGYDWNKVILVGPLFAEANKDFGYIAYNNTQELKNDFDDLSAQIHGSTVLLKGSRSMKIETLIED